MSLLKAVTKFAARNLNDIVLQRDLKNAKTKAYADTGKRMNIARKNGYRIDGHKSYSNSYTKAAEAAKARHNNRDKFISDF